MFKEFFGEILYVDIRVLCCLVFSYAYLGYMFAEGTCVFSGVEYKEALPERLLKSSAVFLVFGIFATKTAYIPPMGTYNQIFHEIEYESIIDVIRMSALYILPYFAVFAFCTLRYFMTKGKKRFFFRITDSELEKMVVGYEKNNKPIEEAMLRDYRVAFKNIEIPDFVGGAEIGIEQIEEDYYSCIYFRPDYALNIWDRFKIKWGYILLLLDIIAPILLWKFDLAAVIFLVCSHLCRLIKAFEVKFIVVVIGVLMCIGYFFKIYQSMYM